MVVQLASGSSSKAALTVRIVVRKRERSWSNGLTADGLRMRSAELEARDTSGSRCKGKRGWGQLETMRTKQRGRALCRLLERSGIQPIDASTRPGYLLATGIVASRFRSIAEPIAR